MLGKIDLHVPQLEETYILRNILFNLGLLKKPPSLCSPCTAQLLQLVPQEIETLTQRNEQEGYGQPKSPRAAESPNVLGFVQGVISSSLSYVYPTVQPSQ